MTREGERDSEGRTEGGRRGSLSPSEQRREGGRMSDGGPEDGG